MKLIKNILVGMAVVASASANAYNIPENMYLVGDATPSGWNSGSPVPMVKENDNTFTWEGNLFNTGSEQALKFLGQKDWSPIAIYAPASGTEITTDSEQIFNVVYGGEDNKWKIKTAGHYRLTLTLDPSKPESDAGTLTVNYLGEPTEIYMLGNVPDKWGDSSNGIAIYGSAGVYTWTGDINYYIENKQLKFALSAGAWNAVTYLVPTEVNLNGSVLEVEPGTYPYQESREDNGGLKDWFWGIKAGQSGQYKVTVNTNDKTITLELLKPFYSFDQNNTTELHMLGLAANSFDSNNPLEMTSLGNGKYQWKGALDHATDDGNGDHANKQFKFITGKGDWNKVYYLVPTGADKDGYIHEIEPGEYDMKMCTWLDGQTGVDAFYGLKPNLKGNYIITADVPNMKLKLEEDTPTGVSEIEAAEADAAEEIFDLNGRKVSREGIAAGIYIVRKAGTAKKVIIK